MASRLNPYLSFKDNAREAMEFYKSIFGGELTVSTFGDYGSQDAGEKNLVMHAQLEAPNDIWLMGSDTPARMTFSKPAGVSISLSGDDETTLQGYWDKLAKGATISQPLTRAPWGDSFGMLTDKFGTPWLVNISGRQQ
jgi:PhnB protein